MNYQFSDSEKMTTNCSFVEKEVTFGNQKYKINIWVTFILLLLNRTQQDKRNLMH